MTKKSGEKAVYIAAFLIALAASLFYFALEHLSLGALSRLPELKFLSVLLPVVYALLFTWGCLLLLGEKGDSDRTLTWLLLFFAFPLLGFFLYLLFGRHTFRARRLRHRLTLWKKGAFPSAVPAPKAPVPLPSGRAKGMSRLVQNGSGFALTQGNQAEILNNGQTIFPAMLKTIQEAKQFVWLETYIFRDDEIGGRFLELLGAKAAEGVEVRIIADGLGTRDFKGRRLKELRRRGINLQFFAPVAFPFFRSNLNFRNHRKLLIADGKTAFLGGANIGDDYLGKDPAVGFWRDVQLKLQGPSVKDLEKIFWQDWIFAAGPSSLRGHLPALPDFPRQDLKNRKHALASQALLKTETAAEPAFCPPKQEAAQPGTKPNKLSHLFSQVPVQIVASGPDSPWEAVMQAYHYAISTASSSIRITSPYFIPNESIATALKTAALAGLEVQLLLPKNPDHLVVYLAAMPYLEQLLEAGAKIWLYKNGFIHSKVVTVDGQIAIVGTANMDQRSFDLNFEINGILYDPAVARAFEADFDRDLKCAVPLKKEEFLCRPLTRRLLESFCRLLSPIL